MKDEIVKSLPMKTLSDITSEAVKEFDVLATNSIARGGLLVTDYPGESGVNTWELDEQSVREYVESIIARTAKEAIEAVRVKGINGISIIRESGSDFTTPRMERAKGFQNAIDEAEEKELEFFGEK